jgi:hypothetical protein
MAMIQADVIGPFAVVDAQSGEDVLKGGQVVLDDERTNVPALLGVHIANVRPYEEKVLDEKPGPRDLGAPVEKVK